MAFPRISHDPAAMGGKLRIRGLHITVGTIAGLIASGSQVASASWRPKRNWNPPTLMGP
jgi:uncharacterized protein (DUF433 family)